MYFTIHKHRKFKRAKCLNMQKFKLREKLIFNYHIMLHNHANNNFNIPFSFSFFIFLFILYLILEIPSDIFLFFSFSLQD